MFQRNDLWCDCLPKFLILVFARNIAITKSSIEIILFCVFYLDLSFDLPEKYHTTLRFNPGYFVIADDLWRGCTRLHQSVQE